MSRRTWRVAVTCALLTVGLAAVTFAQRGRFFGMNMGYEPSYQNVKYDGRFTFVRLKYTVGPGGYYYHGMPSWAHGFVPIGPSDDMAERSLMKILDAISSVHPRTDGSNVFALDDPELFKYPVCYMTEAGFWELSD